MEFVEENVEIEGDHRFVDHTEVKMTSRNPDFFYEVSETTMKDYDKTTKIKK